MFGCADCQNKRIFGLNFINTYIYVKLVFIQYLIASNSKVEHTNSEEASLKGCLMHRTFQPIMTVEMFRKSRNVYEANIGPYFLL